MPAFLRGLEVLILPQQLPTFILIQEKQNTFLLQQLENLDRKLEIGQKSKFPKFNKYHQQLIWFLQSFDVWFRTWAQRTQR